MKRHKLRLRPQVLIIGRKGIYINLDQGLFLPKKYVIPLSKNNKVVDWTHRSRLYMLMYNTHYLIVIHPFAKKGMPMSNDKKLVAKTWSNDKNWGALWYDPSKLTCEKCTNENLTQYLVGHSNVSVTEKCRT